MTTRLLSADAQAVMAAINRTRRLTTLLSRRLADELDCTRQQADTLAAIDDGATRLNEVAQATGQHLSGASRLIESMVGDGLVERHADPDDRRAVALALTDRGTDLLEQARSLIGRTVDDALTKLAPHRRAVLPALLEEFLDAAEAALEHHH